MKSQQHEKIQSNIQNQNPFQTNENTVIPNNTQNTNYPSFENDQFLQREHQDAIMVTSQTLNPNRKIKTWPIDEIYSKKFNFKFKNEKDGYDKYLTKGKSKYVEEKLMRVKIIKEVFDTVAKVHYVPKEAMINSKNAFDGYPNKEIGTIIDVNEHRAKYIVASGYGKFVDEVKEIKKPKLKSSVKRVKQW